MDAALLKFDPRTEKHHFKYKQLFMSYLASIVIFYYAFNSNQIDNKLHSLPLLNAPQSVHISIILI